MHTCGSNLVSHHILSRQKKKESHEKGKTKTLKTTHLFNKIEHNVETTCQFDFICVFVLVQVNTFLFKKVQRKLRVQIELFKRCYWES